MTRTRCFFGACAIAAHFAFLTSVAAQPRSDPPGVERMRLGNGATALLVPIGGTGWVGMETFYSVGFLSEPAGLTQAAHLVEHVVCHGATPGAAPREVLERINAIGLANAETLATFTHYDAAAPADMIEELLIVERDRLTSLAFDDAIVAAEAPRCYSEADSILASGQQPLFKFAWMAAHQALRHGRDHALIRGGLAEAPIKDLRAFHRDHYTPANLTLILVGDFDADEAAALVEKHIGGIAGGQARPPAPLDLGPIAPWTEMTWDAPATAMLIMWPAPEDAGDALALSIASGAAMMKLMSDPEVAQFALFVMPTSGVWPAGDMPVFIYATLKPGADPQRAGDALSRRMAELTIEDPAALAEMARALAAQLASPTMPSAEMITSQGRAIAPQLGKPPETGAGIMLGNIALQLGMREVILHRPDAAAEAAKITPDRLAQLCRDTFGNPDSRKTLILRPQAQDIQDAPR